MAKCKFGPCTREALGKKGRNVYCNAHVAAVRNGRPLKEIRERLHRDFDGRICTNCFTYKPWPNYHTYASGIKMAECKECRAAYKAKKYRENNPL